MWKISIKNTITNQEFGAQFDTETLADAWISEQVASDGWGLPARDIAKNSEYHPSLYIEESDYQRLVKEGVESFIYQTNDAGENVLDVDGNPVIIAQSKTEDLYETYVKLKAEYEVVKQNLSIDPEWIQAQKDIAYVAIGKAIDDLIVDINRYVAGYNTYRQINVDVFVATIYPIMADLSAYRFNTAYKKFLLLTVDGTLITQELYDGVDRLFKRSGLPLN